MEFVSGSWRRAHMLIIYSTTRTQGAIGGLVYHISGILIHKRACIQDVIHKTHPCFKSGPVPSWGHGFAGGNPPFRRCLITEARPGAAPPPAP